jgi:hypothetical protein
MSSRGPLFRLTDSASEYIELTRQQCIDLELALNVTQYGHAWKHIGDVLFNFGFDINDAVNSYSCNLFQFTFLVQLAKEKRILS